MAFALDNGLTPAFLSDEAKRLAPLFDLPVTREYLKRALWAAEYERIKIEITIEGEE